MDALEDLFSGLLVLRLYAVRFTLGEGYCQVYIKPDAVLQEIDIAILRMAHWSYMADGSWLFD
jgi:hypothetical protein